MFLTLNSKNKKIGDISSTYLPIESTCPITCPHKNNGCYAQSGYVGIHVWRLGNQTKGWSAYDIIRQEAREIIKAGPNAKGKSLRLHVSGDVRTEATAQLLGDAANKWDGKVYTYTHAWRTIKRSTFGRISVLASCESLAQAKLAWKRGYAASLIVDKHVSDKAYVENGMKVIPCPQQTRGVTCDKCQLCMKAKFLHDNKTVVAFAAHGAGKRKVSLTVLQPMLVAA